MELSNPHVKEMRRRRVRCSAHERWSMSYEVPNLGVLGGAGFVSARGVDYELVYREATDGTALGYRPTADEVAGSVMLFASPLSAPVTGQILNVNAGAWTS
jgi:hypothetical protein